MDNKANKVIDLFVDVVNSEPFKISKVSTNTTKQELFKLVITEGKKAGIFKECDERNIRKIYFTKDKQDFTLSMNILER